MSSERQNSRLLPERVRGPGMNAHSEAGGARALVSDWLGGIFPARYPQLIGPRATWLTPVWAAVVLLAAFLPVFGPGVWNALVVLAQGVSGPLVRETVEYDWAVSIAAVVLALVVARGLGLTLHEAGVGLPRTGGEWKRHGTAFLLALGWIGGAEFILTVVRLGGVSGYPLPNGGPSAAFFLQVAIAGPQEEVLLIGMLALVLRQVGLRWAWVIVVACVARLSFHLYYGWGAALMVAVWIPPMVLLWRRTGALWAIAAAHSMLDLVHAGLLTLLPHVGALHARFTVLQAIGVAIAVLIGTVGLPIGGLSAGFTIALRAEWLVGPRWRELWSTVRRD